MRRSFGVLSVALILTLAIPGPGSGQGFEDGLVCQEKDGVLYQAHRYPIMITAGTSANRTKLLFGDLGGQCLPKPLILSIQFMVKWAKRQLTGPLPPLIYKNQTDNILGHTLVLPIGPFHFLDQVATDQALIRVLRIEVTGSQGNIGPTTAQLGLRRGAGGEWKIGSVIIP